MRALQEYSATSLADKIREKELPWLVTKWNINKAEDAGDVEYLKSIYRRQEEEALPFLVDSTASPEHQTRPATVASERTESAQDEPGPETGSKRWGSDSHRV